MDKQEIEGRRCPHPGLSPFHSATASYIATSPQLCLYNWLTGLMPKCISALGQLKITQVLASEGMKILQRQKHAAQVFNGLIQLFCEEKYLQKSITSASSLRHKWRWKIWLKKDREFINEFFAQLTRLVTEIWPCWEKYSLILQVLNNSLSDLISLQSFKFLFKMYI